MDTMRCPHCGHEISEDDMGLFGPGKPDGKHSVAALKERQSAARIEDANSSTRPGEITLSEVLLRKFGRR